MFEWFLTKSWLLKAIKALSKLCSCPFERYEERFCMPIMYTYSRPVIYQYTEKKDGRHTFELYFAV